MGTDGFLIIEALVVCLLVAVLSARRVGMTAGIPATIAVAIALVLYNWTSPYSTPGLNFRIVTASFILVPSLLLLGVSRLRWVAAHVWVLFLLSPVLFVGCYIGICAACVKAGVI